MHARDRLPGPDLCRDRFRPQGADRSLLVRQRHRLHQARRLPRLRGNHRRPLAEAAVAPARFRQERSPAARAGATSPTSGTATSPASAAWASASPRRRSCARGIARATTSSSATRTAWPSATAASTRTSRSCNPGRSAISPIIPYGKADLMLGIDILEAARGLDPKGNLRVGGPRTRAIVNRQKTPTIHTLLGTDDFCVETLEKALRANTDATGYFSADVSHLSERVFGTKLYANVIMLGIAFQRGELPLSLESLEWGIQETMGSAATENWLAFKLGRKIAHDAAAGHAARRPSRPTTRSSRKNRRGSSAPAPQGEKLAQHYWRLVTGAMEKLTLDAAHQSLLAQRIYDLIRYEDVAYAENYVERLVRLHARDYEDVQLRRHAGRALEPASRHGDQGRGLRRLPPQQRGKVRARPRALQRPSRTGRQAGPSPSQPARVHPRRPHHPLQDAHAPVDAAPDAPTPNSCAASCPPGTRRKRHSATGTSTSPTSSPRRSIPKPTPRG